jgi:hypothetical protein
MRLARFLLAAWAFALALVAVPAAAHLTPNSEIQLTPRAHDIALDIIVPQGEYAYATGNPVDGSPASLATARSYLADHMRVAGPDREPWTVAIDTVEFVRIAGPPDLHATARLIPPHGVRAGSFAIDWRAVIDRLPSHFALFVLVRNDGEREILGAVRQNQTRLVVDLNGASSWDLLASAVALGAHHIIGGYDHLLFLLALLLPAPLMARGGRWREPRGWRDTIGRLVRIVTAFTIGHSLTLIGATLGGWELPVAPVEIAIAVSVLVSAIHAIRPLAPGCEPVIAAGFGLVHGLAFATLVLQADAAAASSAESLLGFNLGIELVQLGVVLAVAPSLIVLSRGPWYAPLRIGLAGFAAVAASGWIVNRATGGGGRFVERLEGAMGHALWAVGAIALLALISLLVQPRRLAPNGG